MNYDNNMNTLPENLPLAHSLRVSRPILVAVAGHESGSRNNTKKHLARIYITDLIDCGTVADTEYLGLDANIAKSVVASIRYYGGS
jgi:hypothetical protein